MPYATSRSKMNLCTHRHRMPILRNRQRNQTVGEHMEETVAFFAQRVDENTQWVPGSPDDIEQGTDIIINDLRLDVTTDFFDKDNVALPIDTNIIAFDYTTYQLCVRTGNSYKGGQKFTHPVIVIGIPCDSGNYTRRVQDLMAETLEQHMETLLLMADDLRMFYETRDPEYNPTRLTYQEQNGALTFHPIEITVHSKSKLRFDQLSAMAEMQPMTENHRETEMLM